MLSYLKIVTLNYVLYYYNIVSLIYNLLDYQLISFLLIYYYCLAIKDIQKYII